MFVVDSDLNHVELIVMVLFWLVENKNDSATPRPAKKKQKVEKEGNSSVPISQVDDKRGTNKP
jgi:hypothetical protein